MKDYRTKVKKDIQRKVSVLSIMVVCMVVHFSAVAQDTIRFTWQASTREKTFDLFLASNATYTIDWGDGNTTQHKEKQEALRHTYAIGGRYNVTIMANTIDCRFTYLDCSKAELLNLDISNCSLLWSLYCDYNNLTSLNVSNNTQLQSLRCDYNNLTSLNVNSNSLGLAILQCINNRLPLSDLYAVSEILENNGYSRGFRSLGTQTLYPQCVTIGTAFFSDQSIFNEIYTNYTVIQDGIPADPNDYTVTDGKITFHTAGIYTVTMANDAIFSSQSRPAKAMVDIEVVDDTGVAEKDKYSSLRILYPNPAKGQLRIKNEELRDGMVVEIFNIVGQRVLSIESLHSLEPAINVETLPSGVYFLKIDNKVIKFVKK